MGVSDLVGEVPGHLADEAKLAGFDFKLHGALVLGDVVEDEECGVRAVVFADAERLDADAAGNAGV